MQQNEVRRGAVGDADGSGRSGAAFTSHIVQADIFFEKEEPAVDLSQWPHGLRCGSAAAPFVGLCVRIPLGVWMSVCCECCVVR